MKKYTEKEIREIYEEIERQWLYHLMVRAIFPNRVERAIPSWRSEDRTFYREKSIAFSVMTPTQLPKLMELGLAGLPHWLNQNYIIRLFGILDGCSIFKFTEENVYIKIVKYLRNFVGAHTHGYRNSKRREARIVTNLMKNHLSLNKDETTDSSHFFNIPIERLEQLKEECINFVTSLKGRPKPIQENISKIIINKIENLSKENRIHLFEQLKTVYPQFPIYSPDTTSEE